MYYIVNLKENKILSSVPEGPLGSGYKNKDELIWVEEAYKPCYFDTRIDAENAIRILNQYGGFSKRILEVRVAIHG